MATASPVVVDNYPKLPKSLYPIYTTINKLAYGIGVMASMICLASEEAKEKERMKESKDANNSLELDKNPEVTTTAMLKALSRLTYAVFMINFYMIRHMYDMARSPFGVYTYSLTKRAVTSETFTNFMAHLFNILVIVPFEHAKRAVLKQKPDADQTAQPITEPNAENL